MQPFLIAFGASILLTYLARTIARRLEWVAQPRADRWHRQPVAMLGGAAIFVAYLTGFLFLAPTRPELWVITAAGALMFGVGLLDDFTHLRAHYKLLAQIVAATLLVHFQITLDLTGSPILNILLTYFWVIGVTNALNLLDNMDGLCAGVAVIAAFYRGLFSYLDGDPDGMRVAFILAGAAAGFLLFNFNPASIFMGDAGSLFLGFSLAATNLAADYSYVKGTFSVLLFPALILLLPIFDTTLVTLWRKAAGRAVSMGGRDHMSHRLVALGMSERKAVTLLYAFSLISGGIAYLLYLQTFSYLWFAVGLLGVGTVLFGIFLSHVRPADSADATRIIADVTYKQEFLIMGIDLVLAGLAYYGAYALRFENPVEVNRQFVLLLESLPLLVTIQISCNFLFRLYSLSWRHAGAVDVFSVAKSVLVGTSASVLAVTYFYRFEGYSRSVFIIYGVLAFLLFSLSRFSFRFFHQMLVEPAENAVRILIYGAGDGGELLLREIGQNRALGRVAVGFIDDDTRKKGTKISGVPVLGGLEDLGEILERQKVSEVIVSSRQISDGKIETLSEICHQRGVCAKKVLLELKDL